jgi:hypothetical protein
MLHPCMRRAPASSRLLLCLPCMLHGRRRRHAITIGAPACMVRRRRAARCHAGCWHVSVSADGGRPNGCAHCKAYWHPATQGSAPVPRNHIGDWKACSTQLACVTHGGCCQQGRACCCDHACTARVRMQSTWQCCRAQQTKRTKRWWRTLQRCKRSEICCVEATQMLCNGDMAHSVACAWMPLHLHEWIATPKSSTRLQRRHADAREHSMRHSAGMCARCRRVRLAWRTNDVV